MLNRASMRWEINIINLIDSFRAPVWYGRWCRLSPKAPFTCMERMGKSNFLWLFVCSVTKKVVGPTSIFSLENTYLQNRSCQKGRNSSFPARSLDLSREHMYENKFQFPSLHLTPLFLRIYFPRNISTTEQSLRISHGNVPVTNDTKGHIKL